MKVNNEELERQRRQAILDSGKYLKLEIIIGKEEEPVNGRKGTMPCTTMEMRHIGGKQIGYLYLCLEELIQHLEEEYPMFCLTARLGSQCSNLGTFEFDPTEEEN